MNLKEFTRLKERMESLQRDSDRSTGSLEQLLAQLKKEFGVDSLEKAENLVKELEEEQEKIKTNYDKALKKFGEKWDSLFERGEGG